MMLTGFVEDQGLEDILRSEAAGAHAFIAICIQWPLHPDATESFLTSSERDRTRC